MCARNAADSTAAQAAAGYGLVYSIFSGLIFTGLVLLMLKLLKLFDTDFIGRAIQTLPRDFKGFLILVRIKLACMRAQREKRGMQTYWRETVKKYPRKTAIYDVDMQMGWTFTELDQLANQYAHFLKGEGLRRDDVVALLMENGAHFAACWLGCMKLGVVSAWINTNQRLQTLAHSINTAKAKTVITSTALEEAVDEAILLGHLDPNQLKVFVTVPRLGVDQPKIDLFDNVSRSEPACDNPPDMHSTLCLIYTSGTTGLPKAAVIKHYRFFYVSQSGRFALGVTPSDRLYVTLPMYHSSGGMLAFGQTLVHGTTYVVRRRFSARSFWKDCAWNRCTAAMYIGEICRYLLNTPVVSEESEHRVRLMIGNGLRPELWDKFVQRFHIERVAELFGSTEGTTNMANVDNHPGACGFLPLYPCLKPLFPVQLISIDHATGEPLRNEHGYCIPSEPGEDGVMVCAIKKRNPLLDFEGYTDSSCTQKKIIENPFPDVKYMYNSGDILHWDRLGYLYFKDRLGDTYRWKGENVSTTEVESVLQGIKEVADCTAYGVQITGMEGRAGMIAIVPSKHCNDTDLPRECGDKLYKSLPFYAMPLFLRITTDVEKTGTYKLKKSQLQSAGFDPQKCSTDRLFYWDNLDKKYAPITKDVFAAIEKGTIRF